MGSFDLTSFSAANIIGNLIFSGIGFIAFMYGKKNQYYKTMTIGLIMMVFPYITPNTIALYAIGIGLCIALKIFRD